MKILYTLGALLFTLTLVVAWQSGWSLSCPVDDSVIMWLIRLQHERNWIAKIGKKEFDKIATQPDPDDPKKQLWNPATADAKRVQEVQKLVNAQWEKIKPKTKDKAEQEKFDKQAESFKKEAEEQQYPPENEKGNKIKLPTYTVTWWKGYFFTECLPGQMPDAIQRWNNLANKDNLEGVFIENNYASGFTISRIIKNADAFSYNFLLALAAIVTIFGAVAYTEGWVRYVAVCLPVIVMAIFGTFLVTPASCSDVPFCKNVQEKMENRRFNHMRLHCCSPQEAIHLGNQHGVLTKLMILTCYIITFLIAFQAYQGKLESPIIWNACLIWSLITIIIGITIQVLLSSVGDGARPQYFGVVELLGIMSPVIQLFIYSFS